jgi:urease accessory protein
MMRTIAIRTLPALTLLLAATPAVAHPGHDYGTGLAAGLIHPFTGLDHLTAMLLVGIWSMRCYRDRWWVLPFSFMAAMSVGFLAGHAPIALPADGVILATLPVLGIMALFAPRLPIAIAAGTVAAFAVAHGYAHAREASGGHLGFAAGMLVATAFLHGLGLMLGRAIQPRRHGASLHR